MQPALKARKRVLILGFVFNNSHWLVIIYGPRIWFNQNHHIVLYACSIRECTKSFLLAFDSKRKGYIFFLNCCLEFSNKPTSQEFNQQHKLLRAVLKGQTAHFRCNCPHPLKNICTFVFSDSDVGQEDLDDAAWLVSPM